jgi:hypothetical protein
MFVKASNVERTCMMEPPSVNLRVSDKRMRLYWIGSWPAPRQVTRVYPRIERMLGQKYGYLPLDPRPFPPPKPSERKNALHTLNLSDQLTFPVL